MTGGNMQHVFFICLLMTSLALIQADNNKCDAEKFGEECRFFCRCEGNVSCSMTGDCPSGAKCLLTSESGFFGPLCQYEDLIKFQAQNVSHPILTDHDDNTCLSTGTTSTTISLKSPTPFTWFRLVMKTKNRLDNFVISLNSGQPCQNMRKFLVDPLTIDVFCDNNILLDSLSVEGEDISSLCSIYISGGHNVALLQPAQQSSDYRPKGSAEVAVDGILRTREFGQGECTHTNDEADPWWQVTFRHPQLVFWVIIHNRLGQSWIKESVERRLQDVQINTTGLDGVVVHHPYRTNGTRPFYVVIFEQPTVAKALKVYLLGRSRILSICEVNVYGETWCPSGTYGLWCQHNCTCHANNQSCHLVTGQCSSPCPQGKYGFRCNLDCSPTCDQKICNERHGECVACANGYLGTFCEQSCPNGTYGKQCAFFCSKDCTDTCNHVKGNCTCKEPVLGPRCDGTTSNPESSPESEPESAPKPQPKPKEEMGFSLITWIFIWIALLALVPLCCLLLYCCIKRRSKPAESEVQPEREVVHKAGGILTEPEDIEVTGSSVDIRASGSVISGSVASEKQ